MAGRVPQRQHPVLCVAQVIHADSTPSICIRPPAHFDRFVAPSPASPLRDQGRTDSTQGFRLPDRPPTKAKATLINVKAPARNFAPPAQSATHQPPPHCSCLASPRPALPPGKTALPDSTHRPSRPKTPPACLATGSPIPTATDFDRQMLWQRCAFGKNLTNRTRATWIKTIVPPRSFPALRAADARTDD